MTATFASIPTLGNYLVSGYWQPRHWASNSVSVNITGLTAGEQILAISALNAWHEVANISFTFTSGAANITYNHNGSSTAVTSDTFSGTSLTSATVDISSNWWPNTNIYSYMYQTYIHETGHALGLGHEGPYDGSATYGVNNIYTNDTWQWSVMSYNSQNNFGGATYDYVITPEMADIYAIQSIYGSTNTRTGDTTYGFNSNAGSLYDFASYAGLGTPAFTIYDSGGINTLDASGYSQNQTIDLTPGHWSSIGGYVNNIGIYLTTTIRKAIGGTGNDLIITNANATLTGGGGNNTFQGTLFGLASCTITDLHAGDKINFTNASLASFTYDWNGTRLTYANGAYLPIMFSNHPNGQFVLSNDSLYGGIDLTFLDPPKIAGTGDFNRDGTSDFIMYQDAGGIRSLYDLGMLNGQVVDPHLIGRIGTDWQYAGVGDFNGGGTSDFIMYQDVGTIRTLYDFEMQNGQVVNPHLIGRIGTDWQFAGVGDFNRDGTSDFIMYQDAGTTRTLFDFGMRNGQIADAHLIGRIGRDWQFAGVGDFNRDGTSDFIMYQDAGTIRTLYDFEMQNGQVVNPHLIGRIGTDWQFAGVGDFNRDGTSDFIMYQDAGTARTLFDFGMQNGQIADAHVIGRMGTDWQFVGVGDFNGDSTSDFAMTQTGGTTWEFEVSFGQVANAHQVQTGLFGQSGYPAGFGDSGLGDNQADTTSDNPGDVSQVVQAMAGFGGGSGAADGLNNTPFTGETSQQTLLTTSQHA